MIWKNYQYCHKFVISSLPEVQAHRRRQIPDICCQPVKNIIREFLQIEKKR